MEKGDLEAPMDANLKFAISTLPFKGHTQEQFQPLLDQAEVIERLEKTVKKFKLDPTEDVRVREIAKKVQQLRSTLSEIVGDRASPDLCIKRYSELLEARNTLVNLIENNEVPAATIRELFPSLC